jgi:hypothetical protein
MNKRQAQEFYWFAKGFLKATIKLRDESRRRDPLWRTKRTHVTRGMWAAALLVEGDLSKANRRGA